MGKSPSSCFKIISCGADSTGIDDDFFPPESKQSSDKSGWSFRKRSARHQVPNNIVISEPQFVDFDKENPNATTAKFYSVKDSSIPEKPHAIEQANVTAPLSSAVVNSEKTPFLEQTNETAPFSSAVVNSESPSVTGQLNETAQFSSAAVNTEVEVTVDAGRVSTIINADLQEKVAVVIQASARRFLAQRELQKLKNVVKLQAAIRGHLVREEAVGTLRCVQAIAKMQALVRARHARQSQFLEKSSGQEKKEENFWIDSVKRNSDLKSNQQNSTVENLLSNGFAHQLLESTSKAKPIHIRCDPLRHDSAWQWLERWMAATLSKVGQQQELSCAHGYQGARENSNSAYEELDVDPVVGATILFGSKLSPRNSAAAEGERNSNFDNFGKFECQALPIASDQNFSSSAEGDKEHSQGEGDMGMKENNFSQTVRCKESSDIGSQTAHDYPNYADSVTEDLIYTLKLAASDPVETEGEKFDFGSREIHNPSFAAFQAKFEVLSSAPEASRFVRVCRDAAVESKQNHSLVVSMTKHKDLSSTENSTTQNPIIQVAASECGTEISISSTLDSPDRSEIDGGDIVLEIGTSGEGSINMKNGASEASSIEKVKFEAEILSTTSDEFKGEKPKENEGNMANYIGPADSVKVGQQPVGISIPGIWNQQENLKTQAYRPSLEDSPSNHVSAAGSRGTPTSQVAVQSKTSKSQTNIPVRKPRSKLGTKSSPSNVKNDSDKRSSSEHLPKEKQNANRQSSFGIAKLDHTDNEPRCNSSNSLPSYMQATESARAKAYGSVSLKSSPDVYDTENHIKKGHSLPIGDEKQCSSPRVQRSTSQSQQSSKRNNNHSPHSSAERIWQR